MGETKTSSIRWLIALRGAFVLIFGLIALAYPGMTVLGLVYYFGIMAIINGILAIISYAWDKNGMYIFEGIMGIIIGVLVMIYPGITAAVLVWFLVLWLFVVGMMMTVMGVTGEKGTPRASLIISGILMAGLGIFMIIQPVWVKTFNLIWAIGALSIVSGGLQILVALFAKKETMEEGEKVVKKF